MASEPLPAGEPCRGLVFDIRPFSTHDGPGVRTAVFLKGCPLHCLWCCNPESQGRAPELVWLRERCLACDECLPACPGNALFTTPEGTRQVDPARCDLCGRCAGECPGEALNLMGRWLTAGEVLAEVRKDALYHEGSGGGITVTGGEPLAQAEFVFDLLWHYRHEEKGPHTAVETCGEAPWWRFEKLAPVTDLFLYDLKHMDPDEHLRLTGVANDRILDNLRRLAGTGCEVVVRLPLVPGVNDGRDNLEATAAFMAGAGLARIDLLPYHRLGEPKYRRLGRDYPMAGSPAFGPEQSGRAREILEKRGLKVQVGG
jgi:pyruvate formate lyase activating enzyme